MNDSDDSSNMNGYQLSRMWFNFCFENPEKIRPIHTAIYFFAIEHCNRWGWKDKFGFPSQMVMEAVGISNWRTYSSALNELVEFGFIKIIEKSKNQFSSNIIAIVKNTKATTKATTKALDRAIHQQVQKQHTKQSKSTVSIIKPITNELITNNQITIPPQISESLFNDFIAMRKSIKKPLTEKAKELTISKLMEFENKKYGDANKSLEQSIMNCWQGVFEPKPVEEFKRTNQPNNILLNRDALGWDEK